LSLSSATVSDDGRLREYVLLDLVAPPVIDGDLDLLYDKCDGGDVAELVLEIAFAEKVVQVIVETVVDLVDDEDFLYLLGDCLLTAIVDNLKVLLLNLNDLLLLVEVVKSINEVEVAIVAIKAVDDRVEVDLALGGAGKGSRSVDGLCGCVGSVRYAICLGVETWNELTSEANRKHNGNNGLDRHVDDDAGWVKMVISLKRVDGLKRVVIKRHRRIKGSRKVVGQTIKVAKELKRD
jgi:hypothetical protein